LANSYNIHNEYTGTEACLCGRWGCRYAIVYIVRGGVILIFSIVLAGKTSLYVVLATGEFPVVGVQWFLNFVENCAY
jgi:hypothetical protein